MKKLITLFFLFSLCAPVYAQSTLLDRNKKGKTTNKKPNPKAKGKANTTKDVKTNAKGKNKSNVKGNKDSNVMADESIIVDDITYDASNAIMAPVEQTVSEPAEGNVSVQSKQSSNSSKETYPEHNLDDLITIMQEGEKTPMKHLAYSTVTYDDYINYSGHTASITMEIDYPLTLSNLLGKAIYEWIDVAVAKNWSVQQSPLRKYAVPSTPTAHMRHYASQISQAAKCALTEREEDFTIEIMVKFLDEGCRCVSFSMAMDIQCGDTRNRIVEVQTFRTIDGKRFSRNDIVRSGISTIGGVHLPADNVYLKDDALCFIGESTDITNLPKTAIPLSKAQVSLKQEALAMLTDRLGDTTIDGIRYSLGNGKAKILRQADVAGVVNVPEKVQLYGWEYNINGMEASAFQDCTALTGITLPKGIMEVPARAFAGCSQLREAYLPATVTALGPEAFSGTALQLLGIDNVTAIGERCFSACRSLADIIMPKGLKSIGKEAFVDCEALTFITIPEGIASLPDGLFRGCKALHHVAMHGNIVTLGNATFSGTAIRELPHLPRLKRIGERCFANCAALASVILPATMSIMDSGCFSGCTSLTKVRCMWQSPDETVIGEGLFSDISPTAVLEVPKSGKKYYKKKPFSLYFKDVKTFDDKSSTLTIRETTAK